MMQSDQIYDGPSKSQVKRELLAITNLAKEITSLPFDKVKQLGLDEHILESIKIAQKIKSNGEGKRRQIAYIGKLLRQADIDSINKKLYEWENGSKSITAHMHMLESMRDKLIADDTAIQQLLSDFPNLDIQQLRNLIRAARKENQQNSSLHDNQEPQKKAYRALFQFLKSIPFNEEFDNEIDNMINDNE